jgi:hypothetical protein
VTDEARACSLLAQLQLDPCGFEGFTDGVAHRRWLAWQNTLTCLDEDDGGSHPGEGLGHLDTGRPASEYQQPARDFLGAGDVTVGPQALHLSKP